MERDLVGRLRESVKACRALDRSALLEEAAAEIERLRERGRLTPAERGAVWMAIQACGMEKQLNMACDHRQAFAGLWADHEDTLRSLLERMGKKHD